MTRKRTSESAVQCKRMEDDKQENGRWYARERARVQDRARERKMTCKRACEDVRGSLILYEYASERMKQVWSTNRCDRPSIQFHKKTRYQPIDGLTDARTYRRTDRSSYRDTRTHLTRIEEKTRMVNVNADERYAALYSLHYRLPKIDSQQQDVSPLTYNDL